MKKIPFYLACFLCISLVNAQETKTPKSPAELARSRTDHMKTKLNLSEEQSEKVYKLNLEHLTFEQQENEKRKERLKKHESNIKSILDPDQSKKFEEFQSKRKENKGQRKASQKRMHMPSDPEPDEKQ
ncbi:MAG TPA: hypothetical protein PKM97_12645 [Bacteroidia bacterium]|nr:hypothetical protein [Bacteroidia bacterium]